MLEKSIEQIKSWSDTSNIPIFHSEKDEEIKKINWKLLHKTASNSLTDFLKFLSNIQPKFIILEMDRFDYSIVADGYESTINNIKEANSIEVLERFEELNNILKDKHEQAYFYELCFANDGFLFSFSEFADWSSDYSEFADTIEEFKNIDYLIDKYTIPDETMKLSNELAGFELFQKATNKVQRKIAASLFLKDKKLNKGILYTFDSLIEYADSINKMGIEEKIE